MSGLSSKGEIAVIAALTPNAFVSLHVTDPGDTGANEVAGNGYARQGPVTFANAGNNPTVASNTGIITYPQATAPWGTVAFFGVWDALTAGNFRGSGAITTPKTINNGDTARFAANTLTITAQ
jgi:hypothetical protein